MNLIKILCFADERYDNPNLQVHKGSDFKNSLLSALGEETLELNTSYLQKRVFKKQEHSLSLLKTSELS